MRECIYCGRKLEKGEQCTCAMSEARRRMREEPQKTEPDKKTQKNEARERKRREKQARRNAYHASNTHDIRGVFREVWRLFVSFIKSPIDTVMNPGQMSKAVIFTFVIIEGIIGGMCVFALATGAIRGPIGTLGAMLGFGKGYELIRGWLLSALSGAICGTIIFFVYSGVFYLVNKFIFKLFTPYWEFVKRFVFAAIPLTVIGTVGVVLGMFSYTTFSVLVISALTGVVLITYEILKSVWYQKSQTKIIYTMMLCVFVILTILLNLMKFA